MSKDKIDDLIWGEFESRIIEMEVPLWTAREETRAIAMDGAYALLNGFLTFMMFKLGYKPKLPENFKTDLEDNSWWINNLDKSEFMGFSFLNEENYTIPPFVFKQFSNEVGKDIAICILLDWFAFYECGLALKKSKLSEDLKYSDKLKDEFHLRSKKNFEPFLEYMKDLKTHDFADAHKLVLRPDTFAYLIIRLNEMNDNLDNFPKEIITNERWSELSWVEQCGAYGKSELVFCTENNFKELLEKAEIKIPNVEFISFNEFIQDKVEPTNEWPNIRDRYISKLKNYLKEPHLSKDYSVAINYIKESEKFVESKNYGMAVTFAYKALENATNTFSKNPKSSLCNKIDELRSNQELRDHVRNLHYVRITRNEVAHDSEYKITEEDAKDCFDKINRFLADVKKTI